MAAGRPKGSRNKRTARDIRKGTMEGQSPLDFLLEVMRSPIPKELEEKLTGPIDAELAKALTGWHDRRIEAAKAAAPYVHPRLAQVDATIDGNLTIEVVNFADTDPE